jgi:excisionase family DNA binding protein
MDTVYYTPKEVADRLKLRVQTIYDYIRKGRLPAVRLGNRCRIAASDLEAFLERHKGAPLSVTASKPRHDFGTPEERAERNQAALRLAAEWMADESGHDERVWPIVEKLLEEHPVEI